MNKVIKVGQLFLVMLLFLSTGYGQVAHKKKVDALNEYVGFVNESIHGMLIVHRLLENYNQELNKYVDLDSYKINNFSNADLPKDIFDDPDNWFYNTSPYEWEAKAKANTALPTGVKSNLLKEVAGLRVILKQINQLRFDVEKMIATKDLNSRSEVVLVYEKLEEGVTAYKEFYKRQLGIQRSIMSYYNTLPQIKKSDTYYTLHESINEVYRTHRQILTSLRNKTDGKIEIEAASLKRAKDNLDALDIDKIAPPHKTVRRHYKNILDQTHTAHRSTLAFFKTAEVPVESEQYGKYYYYYNTEVINNFNRYGNGIVFEMNSLIDFLNIPSLHFIEMPHFYKVIYPKKLEKVDYLAATNANIQVLPKELKDRTIKQSSRKIRVDSITMRVKFYDHMIEDGDIISLNFNGDWILKEMPLKAKPKEMKLKLNAAGKNYFLLHAENVGRRPPNTMAVEYSYRGKKHQIILESDLNVSELIEIEYVKPR